MNKDVLSALDALQSLATLIADPYYRVPPARGEEIADAMEMIHDALIRLERYTRTAYVFDQGRPADVIAYAKLLDEYRQPCAEKLSFILDLPDMFGKDPFSQGEADDLRDIFERLVAGCRVFQAG